MEISAFSRHGRARSAIYSLRKKMDARVKPAHDGAGMHRRHLTLPIMPRK